MIDPKKITPNAIEQWWTCYESGFYMYDMYDSDFRLGLISDGKFVFELVKIRESRSAENPNFVYYMNHGSRYVSFSDIMDLLFESYPDVAEYFLFHIDELRA